MDILFIMVACGLITFLLRFSFIAGGRWLPHNPRLYDMLRYVPPAVLMALIAPEIFVDQGVVHWDFANHLANLRLWAAVAALLAAWLTRNVLATIGVGMVTLWLLQALAG